MTGGIAPRSSARTARGRDRQSAGPPTARRPARAVAPARRAPEEDLGHRCRPAQGRSLCLLRQDHPSPSRRSIAVDADHSAAWKGTAVHRILEEWHEGGRLRPRDPLRPGPRRCWRDDAIHPMLRALWQPRLLEAIAGWQRWSWPTRPTGRRPIAAEVMGSRPRSPASPLFGKADRIDRLADGGLAIVDYKTGKAPTPESGRRGLRAPAGAARPDRPCRRISRA